MTNLMFDTKERKSGTLIFTAVPRKPYLIHVRCTCCGAEWDTTNPVADLIGCGE